MEYLASEFIELSGNSAIKEGLVYLLPHHIADAVFGDQELFEMFRHEIAEILDRSTEKFHYTFLEMQKEPQFYANVSNLVMANNFARLLFLQHHIDKAEPVLTKALEGRVKELGCGHIDTLDTAHELALLYFKKKEFGESERLIQKAVEWYEKDEKKHASTLPVVYSQALLLLANILMLNGDLINSEMQYSKVLDVGKDSDNFKHINQFVLSKLAEVRRLKAKDRVSTRHEGMGGGGIVFMSKSF